MTIAFFSNFINHHQVHIADELYQLTDGGYTFVETEPMPDSFKKSGYPDYATRPYVLQAWKCQENYENALQIAKDVNVALLGGNVSLPFEIARYNNDKRMLSFEISERWCKKGVINYLSPRFIKWYYNYRKTFYDCNIYKLCCSAYLPNDMYNVGAFRDKCYKWAYFTKAEPFNIEAAIEARKSAKVHIMWCARFIDWKHPEIPVLLANELKKESCLFEIDMYGGGKMKDQIQNMINRMNLNDCVHLCGNVTNDQILKQMRQHDIFLITSDQNEGWGAVVNEALANGCVVIGDEMIGSVPYLIKHGVNGRIYKSGNIKSLKGQVLHYLIHRDELHNNAFAAYNTIIEQWSPKKAAENLFVLIDSLHRGNRNPIEDGPCSMAYPIKKLYNLTKKEN